MIDCTCHKSLRPLSVNVQHSLNGFVALSYLKPSRCFTAKMCDSKDSSRCFPTKNVLRERELPLFSRQKCVTRKTTPVVSRPDVLYFTLHILQTFLLSFRLSASLFFVQAETDFWLSTNFVSFMVLI